MNKSNQESRAVMMTADDRKSVEGLRDEALAQIGKLVREKKEFTALNNARMKTADEDADRRISELVSGEITVVCDVYIDLHEGKARYHRADTHAWVYTRDLTDKERQKPLKFEKAADPKDVKISDTAKEKQPGLALLEGKKLDKDAEPVIRTDDDAVIDVPEELRKSLEERVGVAYVPAVLSAMRDGKEADEAIAIALEQRAKDEAAAPPPPPAKPLTKAQQKAADKAAEKAKKDAELEAARAANAAEDAKNAVENAEATRRTNALLIDNRAELGAILALALHNHAEDVYPLEKLVEQEAELLACVRSVKAYFKLAPAVEVELEGYIGEVASDVLRGETIEDAVAHARKDKAQTAERNELEAASAKLHKRKPYIVKAPDDGAEEDMQRVLRQIAIDTMVERVVPALATEVGAEVADAARDAAERGKWNAKDEIAEELLITRARSLRELLDLHANDLAEMRGDKKSPYAYSSLLSRVMSGETWSKAFGNAQKSYAETIKYRRANADRKAETRKAKPGKDASA